MDEIIQHGSNHGLAETDVTRAVKNLSDGGEIYRTPTGVYKKA